MGEIGEAAEILNVGIEGVELTLKMGKAGLEAIKFLVGIIKYVLDREKLEGKTNMRDLLKQGSDIQVFRFDETKIKEFEKYAKKYGILYTKLPDINKEDKMTEVLFHTEALPRMMALQEKLQVGECISFEDYISHGNPEEIAKIMGTQGEGKNSQSLAESVSPEKMEELGKVKEKLDVAALSKDESKVGITIADKLIFDENEKTVRTRIPMQNNEFLVLKAEDVKTINDGKTRLTFLDKNREYDIFDRDGKVVKKMTGKAIYDRSYDPVSAEIFERTSRRDRQAARRNAGKIPKGPNFKMNGRGR